MNQTEPQERPPLKPAERTFIEPYKNNTYIRRHLLMTANFVQAMLTLDRLFGDEDVNACALAASWGPYISITANDEAHSRRLTGKLMRAFLQKPKTTKVGDAELEAVFDVDGIAVSVRGYKPKTCRYEEVEEVIPAEPEKTEVIPAKPERREKKRILVCDPPAEKALDEEITNISQAESAAETLPEVPF